MEHLKRCKTLTHVLIVMIGSFFILDFCRRYICLDARGQHFTGTVSNEATSEMGYPAWPAGRTCTIFHFRQWQPAKPSTGTSFFQQFSNQTVFAI